MSASANCLTDDVHFKLSVISILSYFAIYALITIIISLNAFVQKPSFCADNHFKAISIFDRCRPYLKAYTLILLHISIQSINIGVTIQLYFISTSKCKIYAIPTSSKNIDALFYCSCSIFLIYRILSSVKIYSVTHNLLDSFFQFVFDHCILKSLHAELIKLKSIAHRQHSIGICHCFQWFCRIHSFLYAAPIAFIQFVAILLVSQPR